MDEFDPDIEYTDIPEEFRAVQQSIDSFVRVNYETARSVAVSMEPTPTDIAHYRGKIMDIIRNNPPLETLPQYYRDGREDYLWYSDFYDDITKDVFRKYKAFTKCDNEITPANYAEELAKIDLPYFKELIDLICLERLLMDHEKKEPKVSNNIKPVEEKLSGEIVSEETKTVSETKQVKPKRSYEPKLNNKQYELLTECIEEISLFSLKLKVTDLKKLLKGKLTEPLQVTNQKTLAYILELLKENRYIKDKWISVAAGNKDFISFRTAGNRKRYGNKKHYITMQQFQNNVKKSKEEAVAGLIEIDEAFEEIEKYRDK